MIVGAQRASEKQGVLGNAAYRGDKNGVVRCCVESAANVAESTILPGQLLQ